MASSTALYWDSSAILAALFRDEHSEEAIRRARASGVHLISSLAWTETHAVIARLARDRSAATVLIDAAREALQTGPWRRVNATPSWELVKSLAIAWPLRGADLWHLATAKSMHAELPELSVLTFDSKLGAAAKGEGLSV